MAGDAKTTAQYIEHHLTNLTYGMNPQTGQWEFAHSAEEAAAMGFWSINVDSMAWSIGLGLAFLMLFRKAAAAATPRMLTTAPSLMHQVPVLRLLRQIVR